MPEQMQLIKLILSRLEKVKGPDSSGNYLAICPMHEDNDQSLSLHPEKGIHCFSPGCQAHKGISPKVLAEKLGISVEEKKQEKKIVATYDYLDENEAMIFQVVRYQPKTFKQRQKANGNGKWTWKVQGLRKVLYRLPELIKAPLDQTVFVCAGEKDVHNLEKLGCLATTNAGGEGKWIAEYNQFLANRPLIILQDNDIAGENDTKLKLSHLLPVAKEVKVAKFPELPPGGDISDWLSEGHTKEELWEYINSLPIATYEIEDQPESLRKRLYVYMVDGGELCVVKYSKDSGDYLSPLTTFVPAIQDEIIRDNGLVEEREYLVSGTLANGKSLPPGTVKEADFPTMHWPRKLWGAKANIYPGAAAKDHVRSYMQLQRNGDEPRRIYTHTGWVKTTDGRRAFLTAGGGVGADGIEVDMPGRLALYSLPEDLSRVDPIDAMKASISFMDFGKPEVMVPLWAEMYLAPLTEMLNPAFTLWLHGHSGSFKSVISALALCHFGNFTHLTLPTSWEYTANRLGWETCMVKDLPLVIDDWAPGATTAAQKEMETKVATVIRNQGNKTGRGRLNADSSPKTDYIPRGLVVTSGEQLPGGESNTARLFICDMEPGDIQKELLDIAQDEAWMYSYAMAKYILTISENWEEVEKRVSARWNSCRDMALASGLHFRLPATVASLYVGLEAGLTHALRIGGITKPDMKERLFNAWNILVGLAAKQGARVDEERPANLFLEAFRTLYSQERLVIIDRSYYTLSEIRDVVTQKPQQLRSHEIFAGWEDKEFYYLLPKAIYASVSEFYSRGGTPLTFKPAAVWRDLRQLGMSECRTGRSDKLVRVGEGDNEKIVSVIKLRKSVVELTTGEK